MSNAHLRGQWERKRACVPNEELNFAERTETSVDFERPILRGIFRTHSRDESSGKIRVRNKSKICNVIILLKFT